MASAHSRLRATGEPAVPRRPGARRIGVAVPRAASAHAAGDERLKVVRSAPDRNRAAAPSAARGALAREQVAELQRARIVTAMGELVRERGVAAVTVAHVVARSGVSRRTFYEIFEDRESCLLVTFERAVDRAARASLIRRSQDPAAAW
jgi:hypothetical protein